MNYISKKSLSESFIALMFYDWDLFWHIVRVKSKFFIDRELVKYHLCSEENVLKHMMHDLLSELQRVNKYCFHCDSTFSLQYCFHNYGIHHAYLEIERSTCKSAYTINLCVDIDLRTKKKIKIGTGDSEKLLKRLKDRNLASELSTILINFENGLNEKNENF